MVNFFVKKLKKLDTFGKSVNFNIDGNDNYQTIIGGLLKIFVVYIFLGHLAFSFEKFRRDPTISYSENANENKNITLNSDQFLFSVSLFNFGELKEVNISDYFDLRLVHFSKMKNEVS